MFYAQNRKLLGLSFIANTILKYRRLKIYIVRFTRHTTLNPVKSKNKLKTIVSLHCRPPVSRAPHQQQQQQQQPHAV
jgi:hypothetical protein